ncbi:transcriptional regulator [Flavilitoribacter nigricans DSM 23189 = NBRC 102662]|uniref:Transcriptional regulator n=2 Tax=Flavilitoribacter TaxID=2762562 RepID=A0A2D0N309_FLAN2|nr:transcriptional regulator [Flavilitoribacter nigricans DSM 23189 = NBRC 102662]
MSEIPKPTQREMTILKILWKLGPATVRQVHEQLIAQKSGKKVGYTTALKMMQVMHEKGLLERTLDGVSHIYTPTISEEENVREVLDNMIRTTFKGSSSKLVMQLLGNHETSPEELDEIRNFLDELDNNAPK